MAFANESLDFEAYLLLNFQKNAFLSFLTEKTW